MQAGTKRCSQPNQKITRKRRTECRQTRYPDPKTSPLHETGASPTTALVTQDPLRKSLAMWLYGFIGYPPRHIAIAPASVGVPQANSGKTLRKSTCKGFWLWLAERKLHPPCERCLRRRNPGVRSRRPPGLAWLGLALESSVARKPARATSSPLKRDTSAARPVRTHPPAPYSTSGESEISTRPFSIV